MPACIDSSAQHDNACVHLLDSLQFAVAASMQSAQAASTLYVLTVQQTNDFLLLYIIDAANVTLALFRAYFGALFSQSHRCSRHLG